MTEPHRGSGNRAKEYSGERVRQGTIVLRSRRRRVVFIAGLAGIVVLGLLTAVLAA